MTDIDLKSFPFDSMEVLNEQSGQMEPDREYLAEIFRNYFAKFLSNGVYYGSYKNYGENSMKVIADTGLNIKVKSGAGLIQGADFENEEDRLITLERPASGNRVDRIVVQFNASLNERKTKLIVKQGNGTTPADLIRTENIYEICIAQVTVRSTSNITASDIVDKRLDKNLCGIVDSLISIDGAEIYQNFQNYIDSVTDNLVRKDRDNILNGNNTINGNLVATSIKDTANKGLSQENFTTTLKNKLNGIANNANNYSLPTATASVLGGVKSGSNITNTNGVLSLTKANVTNALGYTPPTTNTTYGVATTSSNGLMSSADKSKLNGIASGATKNTVSNSLTDTSTTNALSAKQGKVLNEKITEVIQDIEVRERIAEQKYLNIETSDVQLIQGPLRLFDDITFFKNIISPYTFEQVVEGSSNLRITNSYNFRRVSSSSKRYKKNITEKIEDRLNPEALYNLPIKQFKYKEGYLCKESRRQNENILGFIVEDLQEVFESAVEYNEDGTPEMWNYKVMIPAMLKLIQNQKKEIDDLKERVSKLEGAE